MSQAKTRDIMRLLANSETRSAYRSGNDVVVGSELWDDDQHYWVLPASSEIPRDVLEEFGVAVVLRKPAPGLDEFAD